MKITKGFKPSAAQEYYAYCRAKLGDDAFDKAVAAKAGIRPETSSIWKQQEGYLEWLEMRVAYYRQDVNFLLEAVALKNLDDFRFWDAMAKKFGFVNDDGKPGAPSSLTKDDLIELVKAARGSS